MIRILTVVGARPQFIKAAALSRVIKNRFSNDISEMILHTGQHYDQNMSQVFFDELDIPRPEFNLDVGSGDHGRQTAQMIEGIERVLQDVKPDFLVVYGDTNSTLAGAVAASKIGVAVIHIEAGLRSFNKSMPEEINRILCDHVSTLLFSPTFTGIKNLINEGFNPDANPPFSNDNPAIFHCGDVMYDNSLHFAAIAEKKSNVLSQHGLKSGNFILATIHRNNNTDDKKRFTAIFDALNTISRLNETVIFLPLHPRAKKQMMVNLPIYLLAELNGNPFLKIVEPVSFLDMIQLEKHAGLIITDSGGVQKEAYFFEKPSIILRPQTEWVEIVDAGVAILADADKEKIVAAYNQFVQDKTKIYPPLFGDGRAAEFICTKIIDQIHLH